MNNTGIKHGGRTKGTPNKITNDIRLMFTDLLTENFGKLKKDINQLEPKDRVKALLEITKFIIPSLKAIEIDDKNKLENGINPIVVQIMKSNDRD